MKIGIIVAMGKELALLRSHMVTLEQHDGYHLCSHGSHSLVAMQSGIGKVNAALATAKMIDAHHPDLIINTGVAGGTGSQARILDVVAGERVAYHDVWCGPGTELGEASGCPLFFPGSPTVGNLPCMQPRTGLHRGLIASGDIFVARADEVARIRSLYPDVLAVDMESAAIAHTCHLMGVPFYSIRVVSDTPGGNDNISQYENFWDAAPAATFSLLSEILSQLPA